MNHLSIPLIIIGLIFCITPAQSRTFASTDGRTMEADVVSVTKEHRHHQERQQAIHDPSHQPVSGGPEIPRGMAQGSAQEQDPET